MKIAFIADLHLGFSFGNERGEESFENAEQAFKLALKEKPDLILIGGDIFHDKIPRQEVIGKAIELFTKISLKLKKVLLLKKITKDKQVIEKKELIPSIIGIWGTHERRHENSTNPTQLLGKAGLIHLLHTESILVEVGYEKIGIHGLSGVPDDCALDVLKNWKPEPFENAHNVLMLHQNLAELIPAETNAISFKDLPEGFDFYLAGHFHWRVEEQHPKTKAPILLPGSTIVTQLNQKEATAEKGFFIIDLPAEKKLREVRFKQISTRPGHYFLIEVANKRPAEVQFLILNALAKALALVTDNKLKPMIKVKIKGNLAQGFSPSDVNINAIYKDFAGKCILDIDKTDLTTIEAKEKTSLLQDLKDNKISVDNMGIELIKKNLPIKIETQKLEQLLDLLVNEELEKTEELI